MASKLSVKWAYAAVVLAWAASGGFASAQTGAGCVAPIPIAPAPTVAPTPVAGC
jgi:hypothetical protein